MNTTTNTGAASLSDEQIEKGWRDTFSADNPYCPCNLKSFTKAVRWAERHIAPTPQADAAPTFETWATKEGLISESHGVRFVNSMCDVARKAWDAAIAARGAQEPVAVADENDDGLFVEILQGENGTPLKRGDKLYAAPLPREAATVAEGFALVPLKPTAEIVKAGGQARIDDFNRNGTTLSVKDANRVAEAMYRAMVGAAASNGEQ